MELVQFQDDQIVLAKESNDSDDENNQADSDVSSHSKRTFLPGIGHGIDPK